VFCSGAEEDTEGTIHHGEAEITEILRRTLENAENPENAGNAGNGERRECLRR
jgi:hypothetical protein